VRLNPRIFAWLLRRSLFAAFDDGCLSVAKGAAYSALLSFFPVLASAATILVQTRAEFVSRILEGALSQIVPPGTEDLVVQQFRVTGARPVALLVVAGLISVWAASGVIKSLIDGFEAAYRVPRSRGFLHQQAVTMALVLLCALPLVCATVLIVFGAQVESTVLRLLKVDPILTPLSGLTRLISRGARYLLAFITTVSVASTLYFFGPYRRQRWRSIWPGAVLATLCWLLATAGFAWYVRNIGHYNVMYGSVGAGIALLVWMYLMAVIALIGCEFNAELERAAASTAAHPLPSRHGDVSPRSTTEDDAGPGA
jgi:membrane protein